MFNLFSKSKKKTKAAGTSKVRKKSADKKTTPKKANKKKQKNPGPSPETSSGQPNGTPDQTLDQAAEKLEAARRLLDNDATAEDNSAQQSREDLIKQALAVHKVQSKLLDNLDEDTRRRLKTLAMEAKAIKSDQKDN